MGFDLYGVNPKIKEGTAKPKAIDWRTTTDEEKREYFEAVEKFEETNKGVYFRNNVWWWRPLANFIFEETKCVEENEKDNWHFNDGHLVNEETANMIAQQLKYLIKSGRVDEYCVYHSKKVKEAKKHNKKLEVLFNDLKKKVIKKTGINNIAPRDYPKEEKEMWDNIYSQRQPVENYPFSKKNVEEFIEFAENSGGFRIS